MFTARRIIALFLCFGLVSCKTPTDQPGAEISLELFGPVQEVKGHEWPRYTDGRHFEMTLVQHPARISLDLNGGSATVSVTGASLYQEQGKVIGVKLIDYRAGSTLDDALLQHRLLVGVILESKEIRLDELTDMLRSKSDEATEGWPTELSAGRPLNHERISIRSGIRTFYHESDPGESWGAFVEIWENQAP